MGSKITIANKTNEQIVVEVYQLENGSQKRTGDRDTLVIAPNSTDMSITLTGSQEFVVHQGSKVAVKRTGYYDKLLVWDGDDLIVSK